MYLISTILALDKLVALELDHLVVVETLDGDFLQVTDRFLAFALTKPTLCLQVGYDVFALKVLVLHD
jgi:hypothetical protein